LLAGYEGMKQREAKIPEQGKPRLTEAMKRLVQLYEARDQPEKAAAWRRGSAWMICPSTYSPSPEEGRRAGACQDQGTQARAMQETDP